MLYRRILFWSGIVVIGVCLPSILWWQVFAQSEQILSLSQRIRDILLGEPIETVFTVEDTHKEGEGIKDPWSMPEGQRCTIGDIDDEGRPCTVYPFWLLGGKGLWLTEEDPGLLDARRINGQGFMKMVRSFEYVASGAASEPGGVGATV